MESARRSLIESKYGLGKFEEVPQASIITPNFRVSMNTRKTEEKEESPFKEDWVTPKKERWDSVRDSQVRNEASSSLNKMENELKDLRENNWELRGQMEALIVRFPHPRHKRFKFKLIKLKGKCTCLEIGLVKHV